MEQHWIFSQRSTPLREAIINEYDSTPAKITELASRFGLARSTIKFLAWLLEKTQQENQRPWTTKEIERLQELCLITTYRELAEIFKRTEGSIVQEIVRLGILQTHTLFTRKELQRLFGCPRWIIERWREKGWLHFIKNHYYSVEEIRTFIIQHPHEVGKCENRDFEWIAYIVHNIKDGHQQKLKESRGS